MLSKEQLIITIDKALQWTITTIIFNQVASLILSQIQEKLQLLTSFQRYSPLINVFKESTSSSYIVFADFDDSKAVFYSDHKDM